MKSKWVWALLLVVVGVAAYGGKVLATPPSGVTTTVFGVGRFADIDAMTKTDVDSGTRTDFSGSGLGADSSLSCRTHIA